MTSYALYAAGPGFGPTDLIDNIGHFLLNHITTHHNLLQALWPCVKKFNIFPLLGTLHCSSGNMNATEVTGFRLRVSRLSMVVCRKKVMKVWGTPQDKTCLNSKLFSVSYGSSPHELITKSIKYSSEAPANQCNHMHLDFDGFTWIVLQTHLSYQEQFLFFTPHDQSM